MHVEITAALAPWSFPLFKAFIATGSSHFCSFSWVDLAAKGRANAIASKSVDDTGEITNIVLVIYVRDRVAVTTQHVVDLYGPEGKMD
jgi:hypothetical protein